MLEQISPGSVFENPSLEGQLSSQSRESPGSKQATPHRPPTDGSEHSATGSLGGNSALKHPIGNTVTTSFETSLVSDGAHNNMGASLSVNCIIGFWTTGLGLLLRLTQGFAAVAFIVSLPASGSTEPTNCNTGLLTHSMPCSNEVRKHDTTGQADRPCLSLQSRWTRPQGADILPANSRRS